LSIIVLNIFDKNLLLMRKP